MGPIGVNGMALPRNFEFPVAFFDEDLSDWEGESEILYMGCICSINGLSSCCKAGWEVLVLQTTPHAVRCGRLAWKVCSLACLSPQMCKDRPLTFPLNAVASRISTHSKGSLTRLSSIATRATRLCIPF